MRAVWKYEIPVGFDVDRKMPEGARIVYVGAQDPHNPDSVQFWAEVDDSQPTETRQFFIAGTGHPIGPDGEYVGTAICLDGALVWHLYEVPR